MCSLFTLLLLFACLLFMTLMGLKNLREKKPSVIDLYIAESKGLTSGRPSVFYIYPLFQWRFGISQALCQLLLEPTDSEWMKLNTSFIPWFLHLTFHFMHLRKKRVCFFWKIKKVIQPTRSDNRKSFTFHFRNVLQNGHFPKAPVLSSELFFVYVTSWVKRQDLAPHPLLWFL